MKTFYKQAELLTFSFSKISEKLMNKKFQVTTVNKEFIGTVTNIIPSQPDNLPFSITFELEDNKKITITIPNIEVMGALD